MERKPPSPIRSPGTFPGSAPSQSFLSCSKVSSQRKMHALLGHGAAGLIVSNHGGRQLDGVVASMEALPEVVEAVAGRCEVYVDGGVRRGTMS